MTVPLSDYPPPTPPAYAAPPLDDFLSEQALADMIQRGASRRGVVLRRPDGRRYALQHAVRIIGIHSHDTDPYGLIGTVDSIRALLERGFVMNAERVALGRSVYDAEYGYLAELVADPDASGVNPVMR
jgi:hypothetical protein